MKTRLTRLAITRPLLKPEGVITFVAEAPDFPSLGAIYASFRDMPEAPHIRQREFHAYPLALKAIDNAFILIDEATPSSAVYGASVITFVD